MPEIPLAERVAELPLNRALVLLRENFSPTAKDAQGRRKEATEFWRQHGIHHDYETRTEEGFKRAFFSSDIHTTPHAMFALSVKLKPEKGADYERNREALLETVSGAMNRIGTQQNGIVGVREADNGAVFLMVFPHADKEVSKKIKGIMREARSKVEELGGVRPSIQGNAVLRLGFAHSRKTCPGNFGPREAYRWMSEAANRALKTAEKKRLNGISEYKPPTRTGGRARQFIRRVLRSTRPRRR